MSRVTRLEIENFKCIKVFVFSPEGNAVIVGGKNAQGKTSVMDAIEALFGGGRASPDEPIRRGETKARIYGETEDLILTRTFTKKGSKLEVRAKDGSPIKKPQAVLDALTGSLSFDPLLFSRLKPAEQSEMLREIAGLDLSKIDGRIATQFEARKELNAAAKRLKGAAESATMHKGMPPEQLVIGDLVGEYKRRSEHNNERVDIESKIDALVGRGARTMEMIEELSARLKEAEETRDETVGEVARLRAKHSAGHDEDLDEVQAQIDTAEETNAKVRDNIAAFKARKAADAAAMDAETATEELSKAREEKAKAIAAASFPIDGLSVTEDGVTFNNVPFSQASGAERVRISASIGIALNPELRVLLIRDASLLDEDSMAALVKFAEDTDTQLWLEVVTTDKDAASVIIHDGEVA